MTITTPEGHEFVLYPNETVTIDLFSSLFITDGEFKGSYSYAGKAPLIPNKIAIEHANLLEKQTTGRIENLQVRLGTIYWTNVNMTYVVIDQDEIEFTLTLNLSLINNKLKTTTLSQIPFPKYHLGDTAAEIETSMMAAAVNTDYTVIPYAFGNILNYGFAGSVIDAGSSVIRKVEPVINSTRIDGGVLKFNAPNRLVDGRLKYLVVPYFYLAEVLSRITDFLGFQKGGDVFSDPDVRKMVVYNVNAARISTFGLGISNPKGMHISAKDHLPEIPISEFFKSLASMGVYIVLKPATGELHFKLKRNIEKLRKVDWSGRILNLKKIENNLYGGFELQYENTDANNQMEVGKDKVSVGLGEQEEKVSVSSLYNTPLLYQGNPIMPFDSLSGNLMDERYENLTNYTIEGSKKPFPLLFLYQNGFNADRVNLSFKSEITGNELVLGGENGIYETYLKSYLLATSGAKEVEVDLLLSNNELSAWADDDVIVLKSKTGVTSYCLLQQLSFDAREGSSLIKARGKGIVLNSSLYKEFPRDTVFLKVDSASFGWEYSNTSYICRAHFILSLYSNPDCTIPYVNTEAIEADITVICNITDLDFNTERVEKGIRIEIVDGFYEKKIDVFKTNSFSEFMAKGIIIRGLIEAQPSPYFHIV